MRSETVRKRAGKTADTRNRDAVSRNKPRGSQGVARKARRSPAKSATGRAGGDKADDSKSMTRKALLEEALTRVREALAEERPPAKETIQNLVTLLKLHKDLVDESDESGIEEVRVTWPGLIDD